ncbi:MAG: D-glycero-beta-D-manno-heptose 1-phosphate adenylyltransferase [Saprospiraceae bacterium]|nr:D-glycero-beta-D-manno-heptose 1-phosphate adenylyltransferase [Saprospiraceae bacterium]
MSKIKDKVYADLDKALNQVNTWKNEGNKIVFTNGCFDLIHIGHVLYLEEAKNLGDKLIVAANSDNSVRQLKGAHRPIKDEYNRTHILAALASVDMVLVFDEADPMTLIQKLIPHVLVKGGDWNIDQIVGSDVVLAHGGSVKSLQFVDGYSTTALEKKIKETR